ncbi:MAG: excisionase family DNA-binding protein [Candidatus Korobacteraceae bacterium]|jgi:excisionase family DNA binding protein
MAALAEPIRIAPQDEHEVEQASKVYRTLVREHTAALIGPSGERIELPPALLDVLLRVVEKMQEGQAVAVMPLMEELSTQAAADLLGVSRQFFVRECEAHKLPFHYTGTHRRVLLKDLLDYKRQRDQGRRQAIVDIARQSEELGEYDKFIPPEESASTPMVSTRQNGALGNVKERILALVAEKTGYPKEMLDLDLDLEADLGIDTVKQAEMFATIREIYNIARDENRKLRDYPTLAHVIRFVYEQRPDLAVVTSATR